MNLDDRDIDIDNEEYEMVPFEPMMYGYGQMNNMQGMDMSPSMNMNPNMGMNPYMDMSPNMGMPYMQDVNPNIDMDQNDDMFMNSFNPISMMYGDTSIQDNDNEDLREMDKYKDKESYKDAYNPNRYNPKFNDVDSIVRRIEKYNPAVFRVFTSCGLPYAEARASVKRIVRLTLMYSEE